MSWIKNLFNTDNALGLPPIVLIPVGILFRGVTAIASVVAHVTGKRG